MIHRIVAFASTAAGVFAVCSMGYYLVCLYGAARFLGERKAAGERVRPTLPTPPVSILKPLRGTDPGMYESFRSHCLQEYPEYEIIFGVSDPADPALQLVERLKVEFPQRAIRGWSVRRTLAPIPRRAIWRRCWRQAKHENILVNDGDIRVPPDYLRRVMGPLTAPQVGLVTCLYRGIAEPRLWGRAWRRLASARIFPPACWRRGNSKAEFALDWVPRLLSGAAISSPSAALKRWWITWRMITKSADAWRSEGLRVTLSDVVVETFLPAYTLRQFLDHQLRWGRTVRDSRRWGYLGLVLTFGFPWAVLAVAGSQGHSGRGPCWPRFWACESRWPCCGMVRFARSPGIEAAGLASIAGFGRRAGLVGEPDRAPCGLARELFHLEGWQAGANRFLAVCGKKSMGHELGKGTTSSRAATLLKVWCALAPEVAARTCMHFASDALSGENKQTPSG